MHRCGRLAWLTSRHVVAVLRTKNGGQERSEWLLKIKDLQTAFSLAQKRPFYSQNSPPLGI